MKHNGGQDSGGRRPEQILAEIERTRHEMDSTLSAIEHRLTPGQLIDQGLDYLRHSGANEFVQNLGGQAKHNPMPVALMGIGIAWLMATGNRHSSAADYSGYSGSEHTSLGERAGEMRDRAAGAMSEGAQAVRDRVSQAGDRMRNLGDSARHQVDRAKSGIDYMMREQPLALGAVGLAIGAVLAAMAPRTRQEDELMGETRDRLMDQAKQAGKEKLEQAKEVANTTLGTASKEAEQRGLKPQDGKTESAKAGTSPGPKADPLWTGGNPGGSRNVR